MVFIDEYLITMILDSTHTVNDSSTFSAKVFLNNISYINLKYDLRLRRKREKKDKFAPRSKRVQTKCNNRGYLENRHCDSLQTQTRSRLLVSSVGEPWALLISLEASHWLSPSSLSESAASPVIAPDVDSKQQPDSHQAGLYGI